MKPRVVVIFMASMLLAGCSVLEGKPVPPPQPTGQAQEIMRNQTGSLTQIGHVSVAERGSPMDAEDAIRAQANAHKATYYRIVSLTEMFTPGIWRAEAILYR